MVNQESHLGHCLHSKCQIAAIFVFVVISTDSYYEALNTSNLRYLSFNEHLNYRKVNNFRNLTIYNTYRKLLILHHISDNSQTCGSDAKTFVGSMSSLEVTLTVCRILGLLRFSLTGCSWLSKILLHTFKRDIGLKLFLSTLEPSLWSGKNLAFDSASGKTPVLNERLIRYSKYTAVTEPEVLIKTVFRLSYPDDDLLSKLCKIFWISDEFLYIKTLNTHCFLIGVCCYF